MVEKRIVSDVGPRVIRQGIEQMTATIEESRRRLAALAAKLDPDIWSKIKGQELAKRALTVAAVRGQSVLIMGPAGSSKGMLQLAGQQLGLVVYTVELPEGTKFEDRVASVKRTVGKVQAFREAEIFVEVAPIRARDLASRSKPMGLDDVKAVLLHPATNNPIATALRTTPTVADLDEPSRLIVRQAMEELGMTAGVITQAIRTAQAIAALDGSATVGAMHLCEAIQYRNPLQ